MPSHVEVLTIPASGTISNVLSEAWLDQCESLSIQSPATLTGIVTVQSSDLAGGSVWTPVNSPPGTAVVCPANTAIVLTDAPFPQLRLVSSVAEASARQFTVRVKLK